VFYVCGCVKVPVCAEAKDVITCFEFCLCTCWWELSKGKLIGRIPFIVTISPSHTEHIKPIFLSYLNNGFEAIATAYIALSHKTKNQTAYFNFFFHTPFLFFSFCCDKLNGIDTLFRFVHRVQVRNNFPRNGTEKH